MQSEAVSPLSASLQRIYAVFIRYFLLHRYSLIRIFDIFFWPIMELLVWGFVTLYIQQAATGPLAQLILFLIGAMISWDIHYRGQQAVTISLMEEIWTRNLTNILIAPIRFWEWIAATFCYGLLRVLLITTILGFVAHGLYAFNLLEVGWQFLPLAASLLLFGWAIGLITAGILLRFGHAAEAMIWGVPFLLQPFSCVFYPVEALPLWAQWIAKSLPSTYAFEGLRALLREGSVPGEVWPWVIGLNLLFFAGGTLFLITMFRRTQSRGLLGRLGQD